MKSSLKNTRKHFLQLSSFSLVRKKVAKKGNLIYFVLIVESVMNANVTRKLNEDEQLGREFGALRAPEFN